MSILLNYAKDVQGTPSPVLPFPEDILSADILTDGVTEITIPDDYANWAIFFYYGIDAEVWVSVGQSAKVPVSGTFSNGASLLNPVGFKVKAGDVISVLNSGSSTTSVAAALYGLN